MTSFEHFRHPKTKNNSLVGIIFRRFFMTLGVLVFLFLILFFGATTIICYGPSPSARDLFVTTVMETSAAKFLAKIYYTEDEINSILARNTAVDTLEITDENLIDITVSENITEEEHDPIEIFDITGSTYKGKMMIVYDPSRVVVAVPKSFGEESSGLKIDALVKNEGAIAGINAGGFIDELGSGNGGQPSGIVIKDGKILSNTAAAVRPVVGFDIDNKLIVGNMSAAEAIEKNIRDAVSFGPIFIVNGNRTGIAGSGGGLNPRTCIGQTKDGSVLLLTIDGRQGNSLGATYEDCIDILEEYGAINAANLDGGSSTVMYYNDKVINVSASVYGPRKLPSAFVVK